MVRKVIGLIFLAGVLLGTEVNIRAFDTDYIATSDTSGIDSVKISRASKDTAITIDGLTLLGKTIKLELPEIWEDSVLSITTYYDTTVYSFVSPVDYRPTAGDTLFAELVNDSIPIPTDQLDSIRAMSDTVEYCRYTAKVDSSYTGAGYKYIRDVIWQNTTRTITGGALTTPSDYRADLTGIATADQVTEAQSAIISRGDANWLTATGFATATQLTSAQDSIVSAVGLDVDTNTINILTVQDSITDWITAKFFNASTAETVAYVDTVIRTIGVIDTVIADIYYNPLWWGLSDDEISLLIDSEAHNDISLYRGDDKTWNITITDATGDPYNITGATLVLEVKENIDDTTIFLTDTLDIVSGASGTAQMNLSSAQTDLFTKKYYWGWVRYYYSGTGSRETLWHAQIRIRY